MPDWTYNTLVRPFASTPARHGRVLHAFGALGRLPGGTRMIRWFGSTEVSRTDARAPTQVP